MNANIFLLTHKCGNNFIQDIFKRPKSINPLKRILLKKSSLNHYASSYFELTPKQTLEDSAFKKKFINLRCRNFRVEDTKLLIKKLDPKFARFFIFTRHPATFFRSATKYHLRGNENWARERKLEYFDNQTLYETLHKCSNFGEQLIVGMTHFGIKSGLVKNWVENINHLKKRKLNYYQIHCDELWQSKQYIKDFHKLISHGGFNIKYEEIFSKSPIGRKKLKIHSTGEFLKNPYDDYDQNALDFYKMNFNEVESILNF